MVKFRHLLKILAQYDLANTVLRVQVVQSWVWGLVLFGCFFYQYNTVLALDVGSCLKKSGANICLVLL